MIDSTETFLRTTRRVSWNSWVCLGMLGSCCLSTLDAAEPAKPAAAAKPVSFYRDIRPLFQANCHGCHQPAKAKGDYVMTEFEKLLLAGESGKKPLLAGDPKGSHLVQQISLVDGAAEMPRGKPPLIEPEIALISRWIQEGATNDTPVNVQNHYDASHPPVYTRPPIIPSIDFSRDGTLIAVAGFHEVLLHKADGSGLAGRLIGLSERIQAVKFSPDGSKLAAGGGQPGRMGEIQIWDVPKQLLLVSAPSGFDTLYGASWSPDGRIVAFGGPDKMVRAIDAGSGKQVLQQGSHNDWVLDTVFSEKGTHLISVGRDMTAKLTEVATQRFVDNITSITPGALRGGIHAIARHPSKDEILVGGSDGVPSIFQIFRQAARRIGDNAALLRRFPEVEGRIFGAAYSPDGNRIAVGSSLDGRGAVHIFAARFDSTIPTNVLKAYDKVASSYSKEEREAIEQFVTSEITLLHHIRFEQSAIYTVCFSPDGGRVAAAGADGQVHLIDVMSGWPERKFAVAPVNDQPNTAGVSAAVPAEGGSLTTAPHGKAAESATVKPGIAGLPKDSKVVALDLFPAKSELRSRGEHIQYLVHATLNSGAVVDVTRLASYQVSPPLVSISPSGLLTALRDGQATVHVSFASKKAAAKVELAGIKSGYQADFIADVNPVLSKLGCNAGTCHGAREGKNGFKLSLRGYDPIFDTRALTDDHAGRRINVASPDDSLFLLKATGAVPHEGGQRTTPDSEYYSILRAWIARGASFDPASRRVASIEVLPKNPVVQATGARQQMRVIASYSDGSKRDVTAEAFIESGNADVASADASGLVSTARRGEAPVLARFEGNYDATTVTVMGDRDGFVWKSPPTNNRIDELVAAKWRRMKILPSELCSDAEFARRVYLDLSGLPPTTVQLRQFLEEAGESRGKRDALIDKLIGSAEYVEHWANKWADLLQVNRKFLGVEGATAFREWIRHEIQTNTPYNQFAARILTASGSNKDNPPAAYYKILRSPAETMENTTHLFLATRFNCNKCHDHPFERWTQDQYYQLAAYFARTDLKKDEASGDRRIGGSAVENSRPLYEIVFEKTSGEVKHDRTGQVSPPQFPFPAIADTNLLARIAASKSAPPPAATPAAADTKVDPAVKPASQAQGADASSAKPPDGLHAPTRREQLAAWLASPDNRYFAMSYANRIWGYLLGVGLVEPIDDIRAGNPPSNPELLDYLKEEFVRSGFDMRHLLELICKSRTYQLSVATHRWNEDDRVNFSHAIPRRLPAEVLFDAVHVVTGATPSFPGLPKGTRASQLPDAAFDVPSGFLATLGRPARESSCECERSNDIQLASVMTLLSGPALSGAVNDAHNSIAELAAAESDDSKLVNAIFLRVLNRPAAPKETEKVLAAAAELDAQHRELERELDAAEAAWTLKRAELEKQRTDAVQRTESALSSYIASQAASVAAAQRARHSAIADAELPVREYESKLPTLLAAWETSNPAAQASTLWSLVDPKEFRADNGGRLERAGDGALRSPGNRGTLPDYVVIAETGARSITGVKLEVLPDDDAPGFGPGLKEGNFFLSEFMVQAAPKTNAGAFVAAKIASAVVDFIEPGLEIKNTFDGKAEQGLREGWAVGGGEGAPHWAAFRFEQPIDQPSGLVLKFTLQHRYQAPYDIARFRLWFTTAENPLTNGLPQEVADALKSGAATRLPDENSRLLGFYRQMDSEYRKRHQALIAAKRPLPADERLKELELDLARATRPVLTDAVLVQLRQDAAESARQLANRRLTAAQDLTWALINTPAFLFNR